MSRLDLADTYPKSYCWKKSMLAHRGQGCFGIAGREEFDMTFHSWEHRGGHRFKVPVQVEAPFLSDSPLVPEDVSIGGCMVVVSRKPESGKIFECTLRVGDKVYDHCQAEVMWYMNKGKSSSQWSCGLSLKLEGSLREQFATELEKLAKQAGTISPTAFI